MVDTQKKNRKPLILVIEDNSDDWLFIQRALLQQFCQTECVRLTDADQVFSYLEASSQEPDALPGLILLDLYLPSAGRGIRTLQAIKSHHLFRRIPVVTLSRSADPADISEAMNYSSDGYLVKPDHYADWLIRFQELETYWQGSAKPGS